LTTAVGSWAAIGAGAGTIGTCGIGGSCDCIPCRGREPLGQREPLHLVGRRQLHEIQRLEHLGLAGARILRRERVADPRMVGA